MGERRERKREPINRRSEEVLTKDANTSTAAGGTAPADERVHHAERGRGKRHLDKRRHRDGD